MPNRAHVKTLFQLSCSSWALSRRRWRRSWRGPPTP